MEKKPDIKIVSMAPLTGFKAHGPIILNVLRAINVFGLFAATVSCVVVLLKTTARDKAGWWFFDSVSWAFTALSCLFLIGSEFPIVLRVREYYEENWPLLSHEHGLSWLAIAMIMISVRILGSLYNPARPIDGPFKSIVLAGGCLIFATAIITIILSLLFRDPESGLNARTLRSKRAAQAAGVYAEGGSRAANVNVNEKSSGGGGIMGAVSGMFGRKKDANSNNINKHRISPPRTFAPPSRSASNSSSMNHRSSPGPRDYLRPATDDQESPSPSPNDFDRRSPINPEIQRPDTAMHPYFNKFPRYSEASMPRDFI